MTDYIDSADGQGYAKHIGNDAWAIYRFGGCIGVVSGRETAIERMANPTEAMRRETLNVIDGHDALVMAPNDGTPLAHWQARQSSHKV